VPSELPATPRSHFWDDLTAAEQADLVGVARSRTYPSDTVVCHQGDDSDYVLVIKRGWVKVTSPTDEGRNVFLAVRGPSDLICEGAMFGGRQRNATVTSLSPLDTLVVLAGRFTSFLDAHPRVSRMVTKDVVRRWDDDTRRVQAHAYGDGGLRLVQLLIYLAELSLEYGPATAAGEIEISAPLSQAELGSWVDASRETAARAFRALRDRKLVRTGWRRIVIVDLPALRAYADERKAVLLSRET
jgi:CRP/FNR family transcriptional regulator, cyclic AMP receptor protein